MKRIFALILLLGFFAACNSQSDKADQHEEATKHEEHEHMDDGGALELNNGEKWAVNDEMKPYVEKGAQLVDDYIRTEGADYKQLAENLIEQNNSLVNSCTMIGKSHDELHKWLHPHLELVKKLRDESNPDEAAAIIAELQQSYKLYSEYFN